MVLCLLHYSEVGSCDKEFVLILVHLEGCWCTSLRFTYTCNLIRSRCGMLTWVIIVFRVLLLAVAVIGVWILLRNRSELHSLRSAAREQISILLGIRRVVDRTHLVVGLISEGLGPRVLQPDHICETPLSPSGQYPSLQSLVCSEVLVKKRPRYEWKKGTK